MHKMIYRESVARVCPKCLQLYEIVCARVMKLQIADRLGSSKHREHALRGGLVDGGQDVGGRQKL
jgi:hypothetical protein